VIDDEFRDPELARRLGELAGSVPDVTQAYGGVQHRVARVRRRRAAAWSTAAAIGVLLVGLATLRPGRSSETVNVADQTDGSGTVVVTSEPSTSLDSSTTVVDTSTAAAATSTTASSGATGSSTTVDVESVPPIGTAPTPTGAGSPTTTRPPSTTRPATTAQPTPAVTPAPTSPQPTSPPPADVTESRSSIGGSIKVRLSGGRLSLVSSSAAAGFSREVKSSGPSEIDVEFRSDSSRARIRARIVNGAISFEVIEEAGDDDGGSDSTVPDDDTDTTVDDRDDDLDDD
jgi:hypothetical protein